jgi:dihydropteroate synthase
MKPEVMSAALAAGADMINDVNALRAPGALEVIAASNAGVCLMHMQGTPRAMQDDPRYGDVLAEVTEFLTERVRACTSSGIAQERLLVDPGLGFGKDLSHNLQLMAGLPRIQEIGPPVLVGLSRKTMIGKLLNREPHERLFGSLGGALAAVCAGAAVLRVHDVAATVEALTVFQACRIGTAP